MYTINTNDYFKLEKPVVINGAHTIQGNTYKKVKPTLDITSTAMSKSWTHLWFLRSFMPEYSEEQRIWRFGKTFFKVQTI